MLPNVPRSTPSKGSYGFRPGRYAVNQLLWLVGCDGAVSSATMINVSRDGFGLKISRSLRVGERVILRGGAGDIPGEIRWSTDEFAGGIFVQPNYD